MLDALGMLLAALLMVIGFGLLALSQERHFETVFGRAAVSPAELVRRNRIVGAFAIAAALPICIHAEGPGFGGLLWVVVMGACAIFIALLLTWKPSWLRILFFVAVKTRRS